MRRGRKPKPTAKKKLDGNPGHRPLNTAEPEIPTAPVTFDAPPLELLGDVVAQAEWARLAPILRRAGTLTEADRGSLLALCQQWSRYLEANRNVATAGMVVRAPSGYPMPNPYIAIANKALGNCARLWVELGLTPSARSRVSKAPLFEPPADAFAEFDDDEPPSGRTH
jgi:P27 family predicted phage terminase small subunit